MPVELVKKLLKEKEGIRLEFKEAKNELPRNLFESVCAFLNHDGGSILLGVDDDGNVTGVNASKSKQLCADIASLSNNPTKLNPPFLLDPVTIEINEKEIIHLQVPASSQVHRSNDIVFDRSADGDFKVVRPDKIAELYNRKRTHYSEIQIYPALRVSDFKENLLEKVRNLIRSHNPEHPWLTLSDEQLFVTASLYRKDFEANKEGFTLAAALLFGKDEVIKSILPHYKIDLLVRINNVDRYDDRLIIESNLIEAYESILGFVRKHLPDKFYLEKDIRINLREKIFREIAANIVIHREYLNAYPTTFTIYEDRVEALNANNPNGSGPISIKNFSPYPKNPLIAKFFVQLGRVDELGSGIINVTKLLKIYSPGSEPQFIEDYTFRTILPISGLLKNIDENLISLKINELLTEQSRIIKERSTKLVTLLITKERLRTVEIAQTFDLSIRTIKSLLGILQDNKIVKFEGSKKSGYYVLTDQFTSSLSS